MYTTTLFTALTLLPFTTAAGLYTKSSPVLQVDARSYDRLITKSNHTSIVEFYAPWCGHCQNLKPAYEKVATALSGIARVAAVNCDEDENKAFCGTMGVQGFPTLKIVKPGKAKDGKKPRPVVEDYQGQRTAKAINEAVADKVPNHVTRLKDGAVEAWVKKEAEKPKAIFFSEKGVVSPLIKAVAIDFLGSVDVAYMRSTEKATVQQYGVTSFPTVLLLSEGKEAVRYNGEMKKAALLEFLSQAAEPNPDADPAKLLETKAKPSSSKKPKASSSAKTSKSTISPSVADQSSTSVEPESATDVASPPHAPVQAAPQIPSISDEAALQKTCVHTKSTTCILAILPQDASNISPDSNDNPAIAALNEISHKHKARGAALFPFYLVPSASNALAHKLTSELLSQSPATAGAIDILAINAKRGWWTRYPGSAHTQAMIEDWIDNIRFGEFTKEALPEGLVEEIQLEAAPSEAAKVEKKEEEEEKPIELNFQDMAGASGEMGGLKWEWVEVDEDYVPEPPRAAERDEL